MSLAPSKKFQCLFLSWKSTDSCVSLRVENSSKFWVNYQWTPFRHFRQLVEKSSLDRMLNVLSVCWRRVNFISKASFQYGVFQHLFRHLSPCVSLCEMMHVNTLRAFFPDHCWMWELLRAHWKSHLQRQSWSAVSKNCIFFSFWTPGKLQVWSNITCRTSYVQAPNKSFKTVTQMTLKTWYILVTHRLESLKRVTSADLNAQKNKKAKQ